MVVVEVTLRMRRCARSTLQSSAVSTTLVHHEKLCGMHSSLAALAWWQSSEESGMKNKNLRFSAFSTSILSIPVLGALPLYYASSLMYVSFLHDPTFNLVHRSMEMS